MRVGPLRHRMTFQRPSIEKDKFGQPLTTWVDVKPLWVEIRPLSVRELQAAQQVASEVSHEITLRWHPALSDPKAVAAMRGVFGGRIFNIAGSCDPDERRRWLVLQATEGLNDG